MIRTPLSDAEIKKISTTMQTATVAKTPMTVVKTPVSNPMVKRPAVEATKRPAEIQTAFIKDPVSKVRSTTPTSEKELLPAKSTGGSTEKKNTTTVIIVVVVFVIIVVVGYIFWRRSKKRAQNG